MSNNNLTIVGQTGGYSLSAPTGGNLSACPKGYFKVHNNTSDDMWIHIHSGFMKEEEFTPVAAEQAYVPALTEFGLTIGLILCIVLCYRTAVYWLPVLPASDQSHHDTGKTP